MDLHDYQARLDDLMAEMDREVRRARAVRIVSMSPSRRQRRLFGGWALPRRAARERALPGADFQPGS